MPWWLDLLIGLAAAIGAGWLALGGALAVQRPRGRLLGETLRILPDMIRLLRRLATDRSLPRAVRIRLWLLLIYLASPIDIIPDFIPILGYADDAIIAVVVLRSIVRRAGIDTVRARWPGSADGFAALTRIIGLTE